MRHEIHGMGNECRDRRLQGVDAPAHRSISAGFVGPKFEPPSLPLFRHRRRRRMRPQKYFGSWNDWAYQRRTHGCRHGMTRLPDTWSEERPAIR